MKKTVSEYSFERDGCSVWLKVYHESKTIEIGPHYVGYGNQFMFKSPGLSKQHEKWGVIIDLMKEAWEFGMKELHGEKEENYLYEVGDIVELISQPGMKMWFKEEEITLEPISQPEPNNVRGPLFKKGDYVYYKKVLYKLASDADQHLCYYGDAVGLDFADCMNESDMTAAHNFSLFGMV